MAIELNDDQCDRWPICANCEGGLSSTDYEVGYCTQCGAGLNNGPVLDAVKQSRGRATPIEQEGEEAR